MYTLQTEDDIDTTIKKLNWIEPYIIFQDCKEDKYYATLIVDEVIIHLEYITILRAIEILFKVHYIFNLKFHQSFIKFFEFFEIRIFKIKNRVPG